MSRVNDVGGQTNFGSIPLDPSEDDRVPFHADWEARVFALSAVMQARGVYNLHEKRDAMERIPPGEYLAASYYERWLLADKIVCSEKGVLGNGFSNREPNEREGEELGADDIRTAHASLPIAAEVRRFEQALIDAGVVTDAELDDALTRYLDKASPLNGARIIARAWTDPEFKRRVLEDANAVLHELGLEMGGRPHEFRLKLVENSAAHHNVVVCTLCSCYPLFLLGPSPSWYKSEAYRARVVREPRGVLAEFGVVLPPDVEITVWDSSAESRYMVLPRRPAGTDDFDREQLAQLVTRAGMIGTAAV